MACRCSCYNDRAQRIAPSNPSSLHTLLCSSRLNTWADRYSARGTMPGKTGKYAGQWRFVSPTAEYLGSRNQKMHRRHGFMAQLDSAWSSSSMNMFHYLRVPPCTLRRLKSTEYSSILFTEIIHAPQPRQSLKFSKFSIRILILIRSSDNRQRQAGPSSPQKRSTQARATLELASLRSGLARIMILLPDQEGPAIDGFYGVHVGTP